MARSDRLFRLLHALRTFPSPVTASRLAAETGVSLRSLYRDIDALRAGGALIDGERGYGYRLVEDTAMPPQTFDRIELEALALGLAEVRHIGDPALAAAAASVLAKVSATLPTEREQQLFHAVSQVYRIRPRYAPASDLDTVRQGCWREEAVAVLYVDNAGAVTERTILPLAIAYLDRKLMVLAWCCMRQAFRMFDTQRLSQAKLAGTRFRPRRASLLRAYVAQLKSQGATESGLAKVRKGSEGHETPARAEQLPVTVRTEPDDVDHSRGCDIVTGLQVSCAEDAQEGVEPRQERRRVYRAHAVGRQRHAARHAGRHRP